jgi:hypothetical protein
MKKAGNTAFSNFNSSNLSSFSMSDKSNKKSGISGPMVGGSSQGSSSQTPQRNSPGLPNVNDTESQQNKLPKMNSERVPGNQGHRLPAPTSLFTNFTISIIYTNAITPTNLNEQFKLRKEWK